MWSTSSVCLAAVCGLLMQGFEATAYAEGSTLACSGSVTSVHRKDGKPSTYTHTLSAQIRIDYATKQLELTGRERVGDEFILHEWRGNAQVSETVVTFGDDNGKRRVTGELSRQSGSLVVNTKFKNDTTYKIEAVCEKASPKF